MQDINNWMNIVAVWYNAQKKYSWFIEEINPKSLRLIMETTAKYDLAFAHTHEYLKLPHCTKCLHSQSLNKYTKNKYRLQHA
jgi:hypothetical protein